MRKRDAAAFAVGAAILAYVVYSSDPQKVAAALLATKPEYFILAAAAYFLNDVVAAMCLQTITPAKISLREVLLSHMAGMLYSNATPGRVGYYYTSFSIAEKTGTSRSGNIGLLTLFQGLNFLLKVALCLMAVAYFSSYVIDPGSKDYLLMASVFPVAGVLVIIAALYTSIPTRVLARIPKTEKFREYVGRMQDTTREVKTAEIVKILVLALLGWVLVSAQWYFLAASMGVDLGYVTALMLQPLLTTVMFVPISPSGLGLAEGGSVLLFTAIGLTKEYGLAFMLLTRINSILVDAFGLLDSRKKNASQIKTGN